MRFQRFLDQFGTTASMVCAVHCALLPVLMPGLRKLLHKRPVRTGGLPEFKQLRFQLIPTGMQLLTKRRIDQSTPVHPLKTPPQVLLNRLRWIAEHISP